MRTSKVYVFIVCLVVGLMYVRSNIVFGGQNISMTYGSSVSINDYFKGDVSVIGGDNSYISVSGNTIKATGIGKTSVTVRTSEKTHELGIVINPKKVTGLKVGRNKKEALLQWTKQENASYVIYRSTSKKGKYKKIGTLKNSYWADTNYNKVQWVDTKLKSGRKYYYKVKAYCKINGSKVYGPYSSAKKIGKYSKKSTELCYGAMPYINEIRKKNGLRPLLWDYNAEKGAKTRAKEINKDFSHTRPNGKDCMTAYTGVVGYSENIAIGAWSYKVAVGDWMDSPGHKMWLLLGYTEDVMVGEYGCISESGVLYKPNEILPGDVCGMCVAKKDSGFIYVATSIKIIG